MTTAARPPDARLDDILDACSDCLSWTDGRTANDLMADSRTIHALCRCLTIFGEASNHLPSNYRAEMSMIPWRKMIATRNLLVHRYWNVDVGLILLIIKNNLPHLVSTICSWRDSRTNP